MTIVQIREKIKKVGVCSALLPEGRLSRNVPDDEPAGNGILALFC
jgi:hypothetical protein